MTDTKTALAYLFPGQGAQSVGMGASLVESSARARGVFERGREILGWDVLDVCLKGPEEELNSTRVSQPAIFLVSMAVLEALAERRGEDSPPPAAASAGLSVGESSALAERRDPPPAAATAERRDPPPAAATAGLSLGEYSALVFAGSLAFEDAVRIVGARGEYMQEACDVAPGGMTSIIGLDVAKVEEVVKRASAFGLIGIANYNSPTQTVVSGEKAALGAAAEIASELGCRRVLPLKVAGAYHSPLMASATAKLRPLLEEVEIAAPRCPFWSNVRGAIVESPGDIRQGLVDQVESSVRWSAIVEGMVASGVTSALEIGPGNVLKGLARNISRELEVSSISDVESLDKVVA